MNARVDRFAPRSDADLLRLVQQQPLAWVVSGSGDNFRATLLPILAETDGEGRIERLVGHFARSNDQFKLLMQDPKAVMLVLGTNGYISPSWMQDKTQAPTWNYASAQFFVDVDFFEEPPAIEEHLRELVGTMEGQTTRESTSAEWKVDDMGARYASLSRGVIGFRAKVNKVRAKFKLGQDERDDVFADIMTGLRDGGGSGELQEWMREFNPGRG
ncbi:FMN-binding negative transcriptional regulator [Steroidobacter sp.]|uniref:FMN-binding negative transcriptional regulator n=1 Tax=Steroidobacter sp. TaxID=1978227 RepID=UPI0025E9F1D6|nr:FMN-binding negative transcriptional regulator [Steroidobacter sp.]